MDLRIRRGKIRPERSQEHHTTMPTISHTLGITHHSQIEACKKCRIILTSRMRGIQRLWVPTQHGRLTYKSHFQMYMKQDGTNRSWRVIEVKAETMMFQRRKAVGQLYHREIRASISSNSCTLKKRASTWFAQIRWREPSRTSRNCHRPWSSTWTHRQPPRIRLLSCKEKNAAFEWRRRQTSM